MNTVSHHTWRNFIASRATAPAAAGTAATHDQLLSTPAREDFVTRLQEEFDHELLETAMQRVRLRLAPHNWEAFRLTAIEGVPAAAAWGAGNAGGSSQGGSGATGRGSGGNASSGSGGAGSFGGGGGAAATDPEQSAATGSLGVAEVERRALEYER